MIRRGFGITLGFSILLAGASGCRVNAPDLGDFEFADACVTCGDAPPGDGSADGSAVDAAPDPDLLVHLPLDTITAGQTEDFAGNHDGSCGAGTCPMMVAGKRDGALGFDGTNDGLTLAGSVALDPNAGTVSIWVYAAANPPTEETFLGKPVGSMLENTFELYLGTDGKIMASAMPTYITTTATLALSQWTHVAMTWTATNVTVYVNGAQVASMSSSARTLDGNAVLIGMDRDNGTLGGFFEGRLDEVRLYRRTLSASEIAALAI